MQLVPLLSATDIKRFYVKIAARVGSRILPQVSDFGVLVALRASVYGFSDEIMIVHADEGLKKQIIKKFVRRVEVAPDGITIRFIVDAEHYERELVMQKAGSRSQARRHGGQIFTYVGSNILTIGARERT